MNAWKRLVVYLLLMTICSSCSPPKLDVAPGQVDKSKTAPTIKVLYATSEAGSEAVVSAAKQYEAETGINIEISTLSYNSLHEKVFSELAMNRGYYDVIAVDTPWIPKIINHLEPLSSYMMNSQTSGTLQVQDFVSKLFLDTSVYNLVDSSQAPPQLDVISIEKILDKGYEIFSLPIQSNALTISYRKDLFEDAANQALFKAQYGEELKIPETLDDYLRVAQFFTRDIDQDGEIDLYGTSLMAKKHESIFLDFKTFLSVHQVDLFDDQLNPVFQDNPNASQALITYGSWINDYKVTPPDVFNYSWDEVSIAFGYGIVAMGMNYHAMRLQDRIEGGEVGYFMFPGTYQDGELIHRPHFGSWGLAVNKYSSHKEEAFDLVNYLTSSDVQKSYLKYKHHVTRTSAYHAAELLDNDSLKEYYRVLEKSLRVGVGRPRITNYDQVSEVMQNAVLTYLTGKKDAQIVLDEAAEEIAALLKQAGY